MEALGVGGDARIVGKDGQPLTLSKWGDEAWDQAVRAGGASTLCACLHSFGASGEHAHLALDCFAQIRLRCLHKQQSALVDAGMPGGVAAAMKLHADHFAVQRLGCEVLGLMAGYSTRAASGLYAQCAAAAPRERAGEEREVGAAAYEEELAC